MDELRYRQISAEELARGDGKEGRPALVAYRGKVYDVTVSKLWRNGKHVNQHLAGTELTAAMGGAPHLDDVMAAFPVIGLYPDPVGAEHAPPEAGGAELARPADAKGTGQVARGNGEKAALKPVDNGPAAIDHSRPAPAKTFKEAPPLLAWLLRFHPHPIAVHWPIALGFVASCLTALELAWPWLPGTSLSLTAPEGPIHVSWRYILQQASLVNVIICAIFTGPAIWSGWLSWYYNYQCAVTPIFTAKIRWSWVLGILVVLTLAVRFALPGAGQLDGGPQGQAWAYWLYSFLVLCHAPVVIVLGHYGGKITYPE